MQGRRLAALGLLAALLAPQASAAPGLDASHATLAGQASASALLAGVVLEGAACAGSSVLSVDVARGVLQVDSETADVWLNPTVGTSRDTNRTPPEPLAHARADTFAPRDGCRILALPTPPSPLEAPAPGSTLRATATLGWSEVGGPTGEARALLPRAAFDRQPVTLPAGLLPVGSTQPGLLRLDAPFRLVVWEASFALHGGNGTRTVETGDQREPLADPAPAWRRTQSEAYLDVEAGSLTLALSPGIQLHAVRLDLGLEGGRLRLHDPSGLLPVGGGAIPAGSRLLEVEGRAAARLEPSDRRLAADVGGDPRVYLDGVAVRPDQPPGPFPWLLAAAAGLAVAALALRQASLWRARRRMDRLDALMAEHRYGEALDLARRAQAHRARREDARLAEAACLIQMSRYAEAGEALARGGWSPATGPLRDYLQANVDAGLGRTAAATRHLASCLLQAPAFAAEALANPRLAPVVRDALAASRPPAPEESYA